MIRRVHFWLEMNQLVHVAWNLQKDSTILYFFFIVVLFFLEERLVDWSSEVCDKAEP